MKDIDYAYEVHRLLSKKRTTISCIIPAYNEGERIGNVLEIVLAFPCFDEIIAVNDGSKDNTLKVLENYKKKFPNIKVIDIQPNAGKANAVVEAVNHSSSELICLVDADLSGLSFEYLYKMIYFVLNNEYDMTILDRAGDRAAIIGWSQSWVARFNGGERALWKKDFKKIDIDRKSRYAIEQCINMYYVKNEKKVRTIYCPNLYGAYQYNKKGLVDGLKTYRNMFIEVYKASSVKGFYIQVENIVEDRLEPLYEILEKSKNKVQRNTTLGVILAAGLITSIATFAWLNVRNSAKKIVNQE